MRDIRRASILAIIFIVLLRLAIGWQLVYEGLWKWDTLSSPQPWSSQGYLNNAHGPLRDKFRAMIGDPDELNWLDYDTMTDKWDRWAQRFTNHYGLNDDQKEELRILLEGKEKQFSKIKGLPDGVKFDGTNIKYDEEQNEIWFDPWDPPTPSEFAKVRKLVPAEKTESDQPLTGNETEQQAIRDDFLKQLKRLEDLSKRLSYKQKLAAQLKGDPDVTGVVQKTERERGEEEWQMRSTKEEPSEYVVRLGERELYKEMIDDYNKQLAEADQDYEFEHVETLWGKIQAKKSELVGPIKSLEKTLEQDALKILTYEQIAKGGLSPETTPIRKVDLLTIYCLFGFGICLMCGFATRLAALAAAGMLLSFYAVWPPWPGVPEMAGPEHALFINKNVIEAIALMAIAMLPTGTWFGVDGALGWLFNRKRSK